MNFLVLIFSVATWAQGVNLIQEDKKILCNNQEGFEVIIHERDTSFTVKGQGTFNLVEFLDLGILASKNNQIYGHISFTQPDKAIILIGRSVVLHEYQCSDVSIEKHCRSSHLSSIGIENLIWSPTEFRLSLRNQNSLKLPVKKYGTYPNDGTYFLASNTQSTGLHLIDYGQKIQVVYGESHSLNCSYIKD